MSRIRRDNEVVLGMFQNGIAEQVKKSVSSLVGEAHRAGYFTPTGLDTPTLTKEEIVDEIAHKAKMTILRYWRLAENTEGESNDTSGI